MRSRKWRDAAWVLPSVGAALFVFPVFWPLPSDDRASQLGPIYYFFGVWLVLIVCALILSRKAQAAEAGKPVNSGTALDTEANEGRGDV